MTYTQEDITNISITMLLRTMGHKLKSGKNKDLVGIYTDSRTSKDSNMCINSEAGITSCMLANARP